MLGNYLFALQYCTTFAYMRVMFISTVLKILKELAVWFMHSDVNETSIAGNSVLRYIILQGLAQRSLERP